MKIAELLLCDFDAEMASTKRTLEIIPDDKGDYKPHEKSMPMGRLAEHVARLSEFGFMVMTSEEIDVATMKFPDFTFNGNAQLMAHLEESSTKLKNAVSAMSDDDLSRTWKLRFGEHVIAEMPKYVAYRSMYLNHMVHHRAQLGVYLRLLNIPIPGLYGPSADDQFKP